MITSSTIGSGNQLGAQMTDVASLYCLARENEQELVFIDELANWRRGYRFDQTFVMEGVGKLRRSHFSLRDRNAGKGWKVYYNRYKSKIIRRLAQLYYDMVISKYPDFIQISGVGGEYSDNKLRKLQKEKNYDIRSGFGTCKEWIKYKDEIKQLFTFKAEVANEAEQIWQSFHISGTTVSIHYRRTDYLLMSSLNLSEDYYKKAISYFDDENTTFVIFSDDIEACREIDYLQNLKTLFVPSHRGPIDMCLMSKCDHNIIANSSFSFWGAFLNKNKNKKVVCPYKYIGDSSPEWQYINGNWYPEDWIALNEE